MQTQSATHLTRLTSKRAAPVASMGLGDLFSAIAQRFDVKPCSACRGRAITMNRWMPNVFLFRWPWDPPEAVRTFTGRCTGFGSRQCVTAPESFTPDARIVEQCCNGWFQYPWIEIREGEPPRQGCGFCLW